MTKLFQPITFLTIIFFTYCSNNQNTGNTVSNDTTTLKELTIKWNDGLVKQDLQTLETLYAEQVSLYGTSVSKELAILNKSDFFKKHPDFNQSISGDITVIKVTDQQYKVMFPKRSSFSGKTIDVQGYLLFEKLSNMWKITNESDDITDKYVTKIDFTEIAEPNTCIDLVLEILTTSPVFLNKTKGLNEAIIKNGGTSYGILIEGSPNPKKDNSQEYSQTYNFKLYESYPDHIATVGYFSFNPKESQLYEYNMIEEKSHPIDFNRNLLVKFNEICM